MDILEVARQALKRIPQAPPAADNGEAVRKAIAPEPCHEINEFNETNGFIAEKRTIPESEGYEIYPPVTATVICCGWALYRHHGWQRIIGPYPKWLVELDLGNYFASVGDGALNSVILLDGEWP
jgi:hypothetical protein